MEEKRVTDEQLEHRIKRLKELIKKNTDRRNSNNAVSQRVKEDKNKKNKNRTRSKIQKSSRKKNR